jgi:ACS family hexuronate transporter-like MFS transporter
MDVRTKLSYLAMVTGVAAWRMLREPRSAAPPGSPWARESGNFPAAIKTVAEWFPVRASPPALQWIRRQDCRHPLVVRGSPYLRRYEAFIVTGSISFIWLIFVSFHEVPNKAKNHEGRTRYIQSDPPESPRKDSGYGSLPTKKRGLSCWANYRSHLRFYLYWVPKF